MGKVEKKEKGARKKKGGNIPQKCTITAL